MLTLLKHQEKFLAKRKRKHLLVWETGTGKTITAIEWAKSVPELYARTLVICPKSLKTNWKRNIELYSDYHFEFDVMSKEEFKKAVITNSFQHKYHSVIVDEVHFFANYKSQLTKSLLRFINNQRIENVLGLSATPYMSTPWNIYSLGLVMGRAWSWGYFNKAFFVKVDMGGRTVPVVRDNAKELLLPLIDQIADTVRLEDCIDVPKDNTQVEYFELNSQQKTFIKKLYEPHFLTRWTKVHQVCGGTVKNTEYDDEAYTELPSDKLERCVQLGLEVPKPIIVCRYNAELALLQKRFEAQGKKTFVINGQTKDKQSVLDEAHLTPECVVLTNAACSEGWQLPSCNTMIFYSYDFALKNFVQMKGRIQRIDNIQTCTYISLVTSGTVDNDVYKAVVENKMDFQLSIYETR